MNILPKKRWHVRTKENIARVRRDEAKAREEEEEKQRRIELAEKEARLDLLRKNTRSRYDGSTVEEAPPERPEEHVNFFKDLEKGDDKVKKSNKEYENEKKEEKEKYEKQIGYLTYLGQDTVESTGKISWFNKLPDRLQKAEDDSEVQTDKKQKYDPLNKINSYLGKRGDEIEKTDSKKKAKKKRSGKPSIEELRAKRLKREAEEKLRKEITLAKLLGKPPPITEQPKPQPDFRQKYNSQFNPELARQNRSD